MRLKVQWSTRPVRRFAPVSESTLPGRTQGVLRDSCIDTAYWFMLVTFQVTLGFCDLKRIVSINRVFRTLISAAVLLHALLWLEPFMTHPWSENLDVWLLDFDGYGAALPYNPVLYWCLFASWLLILAGLFFYVAAARTGLVVLTITSIALSIAWGVRVFTPYDVALGELLAVVDGALIVMAYWSPVHEEFAQAR